MKQIFEHWAKVYKPGYEVVGASPNVFYPIEGDTQTLRPINPIEPVLTLRGGFSSQLHYEADYLWLSDYPALFLWFAQMQKTPDMVGRFANTFGFLAHGIMETIALPSFQSEDVTAEKQSALREMKPHRKLEWLKGQYICYGEPLKVWYAAIDDMRAAIELWDAFKAGSKPAAKELQSRINSQLKAVSTDVYLGEGGNSLELIVTANSLLSALWLQLALAVDGRKAYKQCPGCQNWFEIGKWGSRGDKKFCSNKCRQAAYDMRKKSQKVSVDFWQETAQIKWQETAQIKLKRVEPS